MCTPFVELSPYIAVSAIAMQLLLIVFAGVIQQLLSPRCTWPFALESNHIVNITYSISEYVNKTLCVSAAQASQ